MSVEKYKNNLIKHWTDSTNQWVERFLSLCDSTPNDIFRQGDGLVREIRHAAIHDEKKGLLLRLKTCESLESVPAFETYREAILEPYEYYGQVHGDVYIPSTQDFVSRDIKGKVEDGAIHLYYSNERFVIDESGQIVDYKELVSCGLIADFVNKKIIFSNHGDMREFINKAYISSHHMTSIPDFWQKLVQTLRTEIPNQSDFLDKIMIDDWADDAKLAEIGMLLQFAIDGEKSELIFEDDWLRRLLLKDIEHCLGRKDTAQFSRLIETMSNSEITKHLFDINDNVYRCISSAKDKFRNLSVLLDFIQYAKELDYCGWFSDDDDIAIFHELQESVSFYYSSHINGRILRFAQIGYSSKQLLTYIKRMSKVEYVYRHHVLDYLMKFLQQKQALDSTLNVVFPNPVSVAESAIKNKLSDEQALSSFLNRRKELWESIDEKDPISKKRGVVVCAYDKTLGEELISNFQNEDTDVLLIQGAKSKKKGVVILRGSMITQVMGISNPQKVNYIREWAKRHHLIFSSKTSYS